MRLLINTFTKYRLFVISDSTKITQRRLTCKVTQAEHLTPPSSERVVPQQITVDKKVAYISEQGMKSFRSDFKDFRKERLGRQRDYNEGFISQFDKLNRLVASENPTFKFLFGFTTNFLGIRFKEYDSEKPYSRHSEPFIGKPRQQVRNQKAPHYGCKRCRSLANELGLRQTVRRQSLVSIVCDALENCELDDYNCSYHGKECQEAHLHYSWKRKNFTWACEKQPDHRRDHQHNGLSNLFTTITNTKDEILMEHRKSLRLLEIQKSNKESSRKFQTQEEKNPEMETSSSSTFQSFKGREEQGNFQGPIRSSPSNKRKFTSSHEDDSRGVKQRMKTDQRRPKISTFMEDRGIIDPRSQIKRSRSYL
ncbi:hypothetical protein G9A89_023482 [Geosiphon pyriformis]|nr:hypothetical protein G9A89_023482 [Geosiphon pyriformis]